MNKDKLIQEIEGLYQQLDRPHAGNIADGIDMYNEAISDVIDVIKQHDHE